MKKALWVCLLLFSNLIIAQELATINGKVLDDQDNPIPFASVSLV